MNYLEAKTVLMYDAHQPQIPFKLIAANLVALLVTAGVLVRLFA